MTLSIITINYNNAEGLLRTIRSVERQTCRDIQWIVVDGGSTDGSVDIIRQNSHLMHWWVSEPDGGIYEAMNKGLDRADGDYVQFLNSGDCLADADVVLDFAASAPEADLVYGDTVLVNADGSRRGDIVPPDRLSMLYFYNNNLNHQAVFFSRRCFQGGRRYDTAYRLCADRDLILRLLFEGFTHSHWHRYAVHYDVTGFSSVQKQRMQQESIRCMDALLPETVARDYDTLVKLRDVDLAKKILDIIHSGRLVRNMARVALWPVHLFARKGRHGL